MGVEKEWVCSEESSLAGAHGARVPGTAGAGHGLQHLALITHWLLTIHPERRAYTHPISPTRRTGLQSAT